jgi:hypothetical protein
MRHKHLNAALRITRKGWHGCVPFATLALLLYGPVYAQTCLGAGDMDAPTQAALVNTAKKYFDMAARGDATALRQNSIAAVASDFSAIETAVKDHQANFATAQAIARPPFLLTVEGDAPIPRAEFLCGVFGSRGQTANSAVFVLNNLPPGSYAVAILDVPTSKGSHTVSFILQQQGSDWKLGGFYIKPSQAAGHDGNWFIEKAHDFKAKGQLRNAWLYYLEARDLLSPVPFMSTLATDKLYDESQAVKPTDLPADAPLDLVAGNKTYKLTAVFPLAVANDFDLVVKYQAADVSNTAQTFQENLAVIRALVAKFPEYRDAFDGVVARAVETSGRDFGSLLAMKDVK